MSGDRVSWGFLLSAGICSAEVASSDHFQLQQHFPVGDPDL